MKNKIINLLGGYSSEYVEKLEKYHRTYCEKLEKELEKKDEIIQMQKEILFFISDSIHNFGGIFVRENKAIEEQYFTNLTIFFSHCRTLANNISKNRYSKEEYKEILDFIKNDFHDFYHYSIKELNIKKFTNLVDKGSLI